MLDFYYFVYVIYKYMYIISSVHTVCLCQRTPQAFNVHFNKLDLGLSALHLTRILCLRVNSLS